MTTLTVHIDETLKEMAQKMAKKDGVTFTFVINQFLKSYAEGKFHFSLSEKKDFEQLSKAFSQKASQKFKKDLLPSLEDQLADI